MTAKGHKHGLPPQIQRDLDDEDRRAEIYEYKTPEQFVKEMFPGPPETPKPQTFTHPDTNITEELPPVEWLKETFHTKSAAIRFLVNKGIPNKVIAKHLGLKHQHVRNVATQPLKRGPNEDWRPKPKALPTLTNTDTTNSDTDDK
jgi:hypothetical protein